MLQFEHGIVEHAFLGLLGLWDDLAILGGVPAVFLASRTRYNHVVQILEGIVTLGKIKLKIDGDDSSFFFNSCNITIFWETLQSFV